MYTLENLQTELLEKTEDKNEEFLRLFHGRGGSYESWEFLTIDSINSVLSIAYFDEIDEVLEKELLELYLRLFETDKYKAVILQKRYLPKAPSELIFGKLAENNYAIENGISYKLNLLNNQNNGFFADMKIGRSFVKDNAKDKNVLNLFSYTCAFSVAAFKGGARCVVNVDMSKKVLETGRDNHRLNDVQIRGTRYMPYNILKSFSRIKKAGPYDLIIIDPPSFQKGSFAATKDYQKIIRRLPELASEQCIVLSCLNSPSLNSQFIKDIFTEQAPDFKFIKRLENMRSFPNIDSERALKNLVFKNF
ncbi:class I SAM-dependent methyltransferase [Sulfurimonas sp. MAG313]|nr:class I SAM-dependent methyltransferase [Sulfurimonas sp. MAG313]MDF1880527.1 class I SAM-dependent methyltransferase [Sulfurimonas sp. MAG313]